MGPKSPKTTIKPKGMNPELSYARLSSEEKLNPREDQAGKKMIKNGSKPPLTRKY